MSGAAAPARLPPRRAEAASLSAAAVALLAGAASAQDRPPVLPERDVAVVYRVVGGPPSAPEVRMAWLAGEGRQRIEAPGAARATVVDHKDLGASFVVSDEHRVVVPLPGRLGASASLPGGAGAAGRFTRTGAAAYAGLRCTVWRYEDETQSGEACITADGVLLRGVSTHEGRTGGVEATRVAYGPQDPARFRRPEGYRVIQPPAPPPGR